MTTKEKLEKALEALKHIELHTIKGGSLHKIASEIYKELTTPRTEKMEVKRWVNVYSDGTLGGTLYDRKDDALNGMDRLRGIPKQEEITIKFERTIPEPETWEGEVIALSPDCNAVCGFPPSWVGKKVIVEVCE